MWELNDKCYVFINWFKFILVGINSIYFSLGLYIGIVIKFYCIVKVILMVIILVYIY